ncbi:MAG: hypothetical protein LC104_07530 [Bacteroidales bacterium]|nr:hypothetical protein [Bacteroidales bacterium]
MSMWFGIWAMTTIGCGSPMGENETDVVPVQGTVSTASGKPLAHVVMRFYRIPAEGVSPLEIYGEAESNGAFTARFNGQDGIPRGQYKVTVKPGGNPQSSVYRFAKSAIPARYTEVETTPLTVDATQPNNQAKLQITQ